MPETFGIWRLDNYARIPGEVFTRGFFSITSTADEVSVVAIESASLTESFPEGTKLEGGWYCLKVEGPLEFSLIGVLAELSGTLSEAGVSIFAISTYETDYLLLRELDAAVEALSEAGYVMVGKHPGAG